MNEMQLGVDGIPSEALLAVLVSRFERLRTRSYGATAELLLRLEEAQYWMEEVPVQEVES